MPDWLGMKARQATRERTLAWSALWSIATRAPFLRKVEESDPDSSYHVAEVLADSGPIINSLDALGHGLVEPKASRAAIRASR